LVIVPGISFTQVFNISHREAITEFASFPTPPGGKTIQIDDGFQYAQAIGAGAASGKKRFLKCLERCVKQVLFHASGSADSDSFRASHCERTPEWLQRDAKANLASIS